MNANADGFATPEEAALATWGETPAAQLEIVKVEIDGAEALVVIADHPGHYDNNFCQQDERGFWMAVSSHGSSGPGSLRS